MDIDLERIRRMKETARASICIYEARIAVLEEMPGEFPQVMVKTYKEAITQLSHVLQAAYS